MPANPDFEKEVQDLNTRVADLEHRFARMREAFVKNDLGIEDYDGHRRGHTKLIEQDQVVNGYKRDITQKAMWASLAGAAVIMGQGLIEWLKAHLR